MKQIKLNSSTRTELGGNSAKRYLKSGKVPAVIYGESGVKHLVMDEKELAAALKAVMGKAVLIEMTFDDESESRYAMIKEVARNPLSEKVLHVDFIEVVRGKPMHAVVPLHYVGESYGAKNENGVVEIHEYEAAIVCRPRDLPEFITIDITNLKVGEAIHLKDVKLPEGVEYSGDTEIAVVTCNVNKVEEEPAAEAAPAEGAPAAEAAK